MAKRLKAKTGTYQNREGKECGNYVDIGVILSNDNGEYALIDPTVSLSGVLAKQNALAAKLGKPERDMVAASIFTDEPRGQQSSPQQQAPQGQHQNNSGWDDTDDIPY